MSAFFIAGVQRSGTTMLSVMLGKHPDIYMEETVKAFRIIAAYQNMLDLLPYNLDLETKEFKEWIVENDSTNRLTEFFEGVVLEEGVNYRDWVSEAIKNRASRNDRKIWGDKAPNLQHYLSDLFLVLPEAKIIHIVRDGRAVAASMRKRSYRNLKLCAQMWVDGNISGLVNQKILGEKKYKIVRYEDLLEHPEEVLRSVCQFLEIDYTDALLDLGSSESENEKYVKSFLDKAKIKDWENQLTEQEIRIVEEIQVETLKAFDYQAGERKFSPLKLRTKLILMQFDNWKNLFRKRKHGMKDRELIVYEDSFFTRLRRFLMFYGNLFLSLEIRRKLFSKYNYKQRSKNRTPYKQK